MKQRLLVTGSTGFVGRHLLDRARADGFSVRVAVRAPSDLPDAVAWNAPLAPPPEAFRDIDAVVHLAAHLPKNYADPAEAARCLEVNALGTLNLLLAAAAAGVPHAVVMSSGNVYAPTESAVETSAAYPSERASYYLASKLAGEIWATHLSTIGTIRVAVLRPSAIYGAGMTGGVVPLFASRLRAGQPITLQDGGRHRVDFVLVNDVVSAALAAVERVAAGTYNVGSGRATSLRELADALRFVTGASPALIEVAPAASTPPTGFPALDVTRATRDLGYAPTPLVAGLRRMLS